MSAKLDFYLETRACWYSSLESITLKIFCAYHRVSSSAWEGVPMGCDRGPAWKVSALKAMEVVKGRTFR